jgi:hypothetical protein
VYLTAHPLSRVYPPPMVDPALWSAAVLSALPSMPAASWVGRQDDASDGALVAVWRDREEAEAAASVQVTTPERVVMGEGRCYRIADVFPAVDVARPPGVLQLTFFAGPHDAAQVRAYDLSGRRVAAALHDQPGICGAIGGYTDDDTHLVVSFADSPQTMRGAIDIIMATELGPDEDPALLTGPDAVQVMSVVRAVGELADVAATPAAGVR